MIDDEKREYMELARKYKLRLGINVLKLESFKLFEEGRNGMEVIFLLTDKFDLNPGTHTFPNTIRRYYYDWKKRQSKH
jgi:hypothetical protein